MVNGKKPIVINNIIQCKFNGIIMDDEGCNNGGTSLHIPNLISHFLGNSNSYIVACEILRFPCEIKT